jgi:Ni/Fe-hydrogenase subunit HybB-like protein
MIVCNAVIPQLFWFRKIRRNWIWLLMVSLSINIGMWLERFNIVITSLNKDYLPSNWASYTPTPIDIGVFVGTLGLFGIGVLLFMRYIPMMAISELKSVAHIGNKQED